MVDSSSLSKALQDLAGLETPQPRRSAFPKRGEVPPPRPRENIPKTMPISHSPEGAVAEKSQELPEFTSAISKEEAATFARPTPRKLSIFGRASGVPLSEEHEQDLTRDSAPRVRPAKLPKLTHEQERVVECTERRIKVKAFAGAGKALRIDQPVLTPKGYRCIGDLAVGDPVIGSDGKTYPVLGVFPQGKRDLFTVRFSDKTEIVADAEHRWLVQRTDHRYATRRGGVVKTTAELAEKLTTPSNAKGGVGRRAYWFMPMCEPVLFPKTEVPMDPWLLGILIGDGTLKGTVSLSTADRQILDGVKTIVEPMGVVVRKYPSSKYDYRLGGRQVRAGHRGFFNPIVNALKAVGLRPSSGGLKGPQKFIPDCYKMGDTQTRVALLQGLFDTNGGRSKQAVEFTSCSKRLAEDVKFMVESLGGAAVLSIKKNTVFTYKGVRKTGRIAYRLYIKVPVWMEPFRLKRKMLGWSGGQRPPLRTIKSIEPCGHGEAVCISVDSPDHLFLTASCIPTHNTSMLVGYANRRLHGRWLYLAFNRDIKEEASARFPSHVKCSTSHGLAFAQFGVPLQEKLNLGVRWKNVYESTRIKAAPEIQRTYARLLLNTIANFVGSADMGLSNEHLPEKELRLLLSNEKLAASGKLPDATQMIKDAEQLWLAMLDPKNLKIGATHDTYLKLMQLASPVLPYDGILLDESQDSNPAVLSLVQDQPGIQVMVGDPHQSIYAFRKAVDAMTIAHADQILELTGSFRYGPEIADFANTILAMKGETSTIRGLAGRGQVGLMAPRNAPGRTAFISRTNAVLFREAAYRASSNQKIYIAGGLENARFDLLSDLHLMHSKKGVPSDPLLATFGSYEEFKMAVQENEEQEWIVRCKIVEELGSSLPQRLAAIEKNCVSDIRQAHQIFATAHKSKGLEFEHVTLGDDFYGAHPSKGETHRLTEPKEVEETNALYVAATRARISLTLPQAQYSFWKAISPLIDPDTPQPQRTRLIIGMKPETATHLERVALHREGEIRTNPLPTVIRSEELSEGPPLEDCDRDPFDAPTIEAPKRRRL